MSSLCLAVCAHDDRPALERLLRNLRHFAPDATIVMFDGGSDPGLHEGLDVEVCPYSRPLRYGNVAHFHLGVMRWLYETRRDFEFIVAVESDMMLIKPGLAGFLQRSMTRHGWLSYNGSCFGAVPTGTDRIGRGWWRIWQSEWQEFLGVPAPYHVLNPGQVFRADYVEQLMRWPGLAQLSDRIDLSRLFALEEMLWPTLAVVLDRAGGWLPGSHAVQVRRHSPLEIESYLDDPRCYFVHRVGTRADDPEQQIVRALEAGVRPDFAAMDDSYVDAHHPPLATVARAVAAPRVRARWARTYRRALKR